MNKCFLLQDPTLEGAYEICGIIFMFLPQYNIGMALYRINFIYTLYEQGALYLSRFFHFINVWHFR